MTSVQRDKLVVLAYFPKMKVGLFVFARNNFYNSFTGYAHSVHQLLEDNHPPFSVCLYDSANCF
jgi:hypothetical protein